MSEWISVANGRGPENVDLDNMGRVLVLNDFSGFAHLIHIDHLYDEAAYTHWQPLPERPQ